MNFAGGLRHGASKHRRGRHRHAFRRGRSVPPNDTLASRLPGERGRTVTVAMKTGTTLTPPDVVVLTADVRRTRDGHLQAFVSWLWTASTNKNVSRGASEKLDFTIHWARQTCNVDARLPHCNDPDAYYSRTVWTLGYKVRRSIIY